MELQGLKLPLRLMNHLSTKNQSGDGGKKRAGDNLMKVKIYFGRTTFWINESINLNEVT